MTEEEALQAAETKLLNFVVKHGHITTKYRGYQIDIVAKKTSYVQQLSKAVGFTSSDEQPSS